MRGRKGMNAAFLTPNGKRLTASGLAQRRNEFSFAKQFTAIPRGVDSNRAQKGLTTASLP